MTLDRRQLLAGLLALGACAPRSSPRGDVFAAGQPAAILVLAPASDRLLGWPRRPSAAALALLPGADLPETGALASGGAPASLEAVAALSPSLIVDYGDLDPRYRGVAARVEQRLGVPYRLFDGALIRAPQALADAGLLLGRSERGRMLANRAADLIDRWRRAAAGGPSFYYARGGDGLETGFVGSLATEVLEGAGWRNVAVGGGGRVGRVSREQVAAWDPEAIVTLDSAFARAALADPFWARGRSGRPRRLLLVPDLPFGWVDRPPSINRLLGCAWLGAGDRAAAEVATLLWSVPPAALAGIGARWLA